MTPLKVTRAQARRLERNLSGQGRRDADPTHDTSFVLRILWAGWEIGTGRRPTTEDVKKLSRGMQNAAKKYLPELKRRRR